MVELIQRYRKQVEVAFAYAADDKKGAPTSTFEIMIGHFADLGKDFESLVGSLQKELAEARAERDELRAADRDHAGAWLSSDKRRSIAEARADALAKEVARAERELVKSRDKAATYLRERDALAKKAEGLEGALREIEGRDSSIDASPRGDREVILGQFARRARAALEQKP